MQRGRISGQGAVIPTLPGGEHGGGAEAPACEGQLALVVAEGHRSGRCGAEGRDVASVGVQRGGRNRLAEALVLLPAVVARSRLQGPGLMGKAPP